MTYQASRDETEDLGHIFHAFVGARAVAQAAADKANEAAGEYQQKLLVLMGKLGIAPELINQVKVQWHSGVVTITDPFVAPVAVPTSDGAVVPA